MHIVKASENDEKQVYAFVCELEECTFDKTVFQKQWLHNFKDSSITYYFLMKEDERIGFCSLRMVHHLHHCAKIAQIEEFIIQKEYQHKGYGRRMIEELFMIAKQADCLMVELSSNRKRKSAHAFYERIGMRKQHYKFTRYL